MPEQTVLKTGIKQRKTKTIILRILLTILGIFLIGYGIIALFFNLKVALLIIAGGGAILFFLLYHAYDPKG